MNAECPMPKNNAKWWGTEKERGRGEEGRGGQSEQVRYLHGPLISEGLIKFNRFDCGNVVHITKGFQTFGRADLTFMYVRSCRKVCWY